MIDKANLDLLPLTLLNMLELLDENNQGITDHETMKNKMNKIKLLHDKSLEYIKNELCKRKEKYDRINNYSNKYNTDIDFTTIETIYLNDIKECEYVLKDIMDITNIIMKSSIVDVYDHINNIFIKTQYMLYFSI